MDNRKTATRPGSKGMMDKPEDTLTDATPKLGAGAQRGPASLLVLSGKAIGRMFKLTKPEMLLGRGDDSDIAIDDVAISRHHAKVTFRPNHSIWVEDLGSKNGTYFEGEKVSTIELHDGDRFQVGSSTILKLTYQDDAEEEFQRQLYESATRDGLTGLFNRKFLLDGIAAEFAYCLRHKKTLSLCMFDIDHFRTFQDEWGPAAGEAVLIQFAHLLDKASRTEDIICRYGGEQFAVLLREIDEKNAHTYAERIRKRVEQAEFVFNDRDGGRQSIRITLTIGMATLGNTPYGNIDDFITAADKHLLQAKRAGQNSIARVADNG